MPQNTRSKKKQVEKRVPDDVLDTTEGINENQNHASDNSEKKTRKRSISGESTKAIKKTKSDRQINTEQEFDEVTGTVAHFKEGDNIVQIEVKGNDRDMFPIDEEEDSADESDESGVSDEGLVNHSLATTTTESSSSEVDDESEVNQKHDCRICKK